MNASVICARGATNFLQWTERIPGTSIYECADFGEIKEAVQSSDTLFLEWGTDTAAIVSNLPEIKDKKVVLRIHSYEVLHGNITRINFENIDTVIFVARHVEELAHRMVKINKSVVVPNGIDLDKFKLTERTHGEDIAVLSYLKDHKGTQLAMHCLEALYGYTLHWAGEVQSLRSQIYLRYIAKEMNLKDNLKLYGHQEPVEFLKDKNYLLSTSMWEGCPVGILEAMATGLMPLIHNFPGAKAIFPENLIWTTIADLGNLINSEYNSEEYRDFVFKNHNIINQAKTIQEILED